MRAKHGIVVLTTATLLATNARAAFAGGTNEQVSVSSDGKQANGNSQRPSISRDGRFVTFDRRPTGQASSTSTSVTAIRAPTSWPARRRPAARPTATAATA